MTPAALALALHAATAAPQPHEVPALPILVDGTAAAQCPDRHSASALYALRVGPMDGDEATELRQGYDRAVAEWAVCARVLALPNWGVPDVHDPMARQLLSASLTEPGHRARIEAIERTADTLPYATALLALEELAVIELLGRAEPQRRVELAGAAFGAWGCGSARTWVADPSGEETGFCADSRGIETMATSGMLRLAQLAAPTAQPPNTWLARATQDRVAAWWTAIGQTWFPLAEPPPVRAPDGGVGAPLEPGTGWSGRLASDLVAWQERPAFRVAPTGLEVKQPSIRTSAPESWDGAPVLYIDGDLRLGELAEALAHAGVARPIFVAQRDGTVNPRDLVELRLLWRPDGAPPPGATVVSLAALGGSMDRIRQQVAAHAGAGPAWIDAHPHARYADLVAAHAAVTRARTGPVVVRLQEPR